MAATVVVDAPHDRDLLALFVSVDGLLTDAAVVEVQVADVSGPSPSVVFPAVGDWEDVTVAGRYATGTYAVIDTGVPWTPTEAITLGQVNWRFKVAAGDDWTYVRRRFEAVVETVTGGTQYAVPVLIQDAKAAGLPATVSDADAHARVLRTRDLIERVCRQRFRLVRETRRMQGYHYPVLHLPEPLYGLESIVEGITTLDTTRIKVYGAIGNERRNPRLEIDASAVSYVEIMGVHDVFSQYLTQAITGVWGFVESETFEAPQAIRDVVLTEVLAAYGVAAAGSTGAAGPIQSESTDGHSITYAIAAGRGRSGGLSLLSQESRDMLMLYRAPIVLKAPRTMWW